MELFTQHTNKDRINLYFKKDAHGFNPAELCAVEEAFMRHYSIKPLDIVEENNAVKMVFTRPPHLPPDTLADCARMILDHCKVDKIALCAQCKKKKSYCNIVEPK